MIHVTTNQCQQQINPSNKINLLLRTVDSVLFRAPGSGEKGCLPRRVVRVDHQVVVSMELNGPGHRGQIQKTCVIENVDKQLEHSQPARQRSEGYRDWTSVVLKIRLRISSPLRARHPGHHLRPSRVSPHRATSA